MTAEEIVRNIQSNTEKDNEALYLQLWQFIYKLVYLKAAQRCNSEGRSSHEVEDICQESYLMLPKAAAGFDPEKSSSFVTYFCRYYLPIAARIALYGSRSGDTDPLNDPYRESLDRSLPGPDGEECDSIVDLLADPQAETPFHTIDEADYWRSVDKYLTRGIAALPEKQRTLISYTYRTGATISDAFRNKIIGSASRSYYGQVYRNGIRGLRKWIECKTSKEAERLNIWDKFSRCYYAGGFRSFRNHNYTSNVERIALRHIAKAEKISSMEDLASKLRA